MKPHRYLSWRKRAGIGTGQKNPIKLSFSSNINFHTARFCKVFHNRRGRQWGRPWSSSVSKDKQWMWASNCLCKSSPNQVGKEVLCHMQRNARPNLGSQALSPYLCGQQFEVSTDHNSLKWLYSFWEPERQITRWLNVLAEYDFIITHRPGIKHTNADALSWNIPENSNTPGQWGHTTTSISHVLCHNWLGATSPSQIQAAQCKEPSLLTVATWLEKDVIPQHCPKNWQ